MTLVRLATHAGTWYNSSQRQLLKEFQSYFRKLDKDELDSDVTPVGPKKGARILIGPHAGYTYSGERLAETFSVWDNSNVERVFLLGPSHHVYFKGKVLLSKFDSYSTPFGNLPVDRDVNEELILSGSKGIFGYMSEDVDEEEHSFEMHAPFIYHKCKDLPQGVPHIIPILISGMDDSLNKKLVNALLPYIQDPRNHFVISSDFCHWGTRFGYTEYFAEKPEGIDSDKFNLVSLLHSSKLKHFSTPIYKSIENLDKIAMDIASTGSYKEWVKYIKSTKNTICGQKAIGVILRLIEEYNLSPECTQKFSTFNWINYSQSSHVLRVLDSSVSYASGYIQTV